MEERPLGGSGVAVTRIMLGCGNFGGIGSSPAFFGQGTSKDEAFRLHGHRLGARHHHLRHRRRLRRRPQRELHRRVARDEGRRRPRPDRDRHEDVQPDGRGRGPRPRPRAHPPPARGEPATPRGRARGALPRARLRPRHAAGGDAAGVRRARPRPARSARSGRRTSPASSSRRRSSCRSSKGSPRYEWVQNGFSLLEQGDRETVFPVCREHGLGYTPFSPLAGGWLTGKYRRGEAPPPGSRMTLRPEPYEGYTSDRVFDALEALEARGGSARRLDGGPRARLAAGARRGDGRHRRARPGRPPGTGRRGDLDLSHTHRTRLTDGGLPMSVLVLSEHDVRELLDMESCIDRDGGRPRPARARRAAQPASLRHAPAGAGR